MPESFSHCDGVSIDHQEKKEQIKKPEETLDSILDVELNVENINSYTTDAFNRLVAFADKKIADYRKIESVENLSYTEIEDVAFKYYGLESINSILDYIADKSKEIRDLDKIIDSADKVDNVIVQPDVVSQNISNNGNGEFKEKRMIDRLKTVLFVLKEDFDVDLNDEANFKIQKGIVSKNMMRKTSYYLVNASAINRTILICDEEGNASYVFDSKKIEEKKINNDSLINYTKSELNDLLKEDPEIGRRVIYSKEGFVPRIIDSIKNPISTIPDEFSPRLKDMSFSYLYPKHPENYLSINGIAEKFEISHVLVSKVIKDIEDQLGEVGKYKFGTVTTLGYSPDQQEIIKKSFQEKGLLKPEVPENYLSINGIAEKFNVCPTSVSKVIKDIEDQLGDINKYRFKGKITSGYSPDQQEIIKKYLDEKGLLKPEVPEGYLSMKGITEKFEISDFLVSKVIKDIEDQLGEVGKYKFGAVTTSGYSQEQQEIIKNYLQEKGLLQPEPPEGYLAVSRIAKELGLNFESVSKIIKDIEDQLGEVGKYKFGTVTTLGYSPEQQKIIINYINNRKKK